jgi:nucleoside phosphorylase/CheY-like chemotaxis protein
MSVKIIIVDDDQDKIREISGALIKDAGVSYEDLTFARDLREAKTALRNNSYDLMVLDMALPLTSDREPNHLAGLDLLEELEERDVYNVPSFIVGLSAYQEEIISAQKRFEKALWSLITYDAASNEWRHALCQKVSHIRRSLQSGTSPKKYENDVLWICALEDPELSAVLRLPFEWTLCPAQQSLCYHYAGKHSNDARTLTLCATALPHMGPVASAAYTARLIEEFRPRYVIMSGIMAGIRGRTNLGDVIIANPTWDWGSGKRVSLESSGEGTNFLSAPYQENVDTALVNVCRQIRNQATLLAGIRSGWEGDTPDSVLQIHEGPVASGASVIADSGFISDLKRQHRKLLGLEMEAYAMMFACSHASEPRPKGIVVKGVCDFADEGKSDGFQKYSAYASAKVCQEIIEKL